MVSKFDSADNQADEIRERMRLLQQDRRTNVDLLESKQAANIEEIRYFRAENKTLRTRASQLQKYLQVNDGHQNEVELLKRELVALKMEFDSLKVESVRRSKQIDTLRDELRVCHVEAQSYHDEDPISRKLLLLENRLDDATIKYNEAQSIRGTYEHIVRRLKEERVSYDNQLTALERTLKSKDHDYEELLTLAHDATHACETAQNDLRHVRSQYAEKMEKRDAALRERRQLVRIRKQIMEKTQQTDLKRTTPSYRMLGDPRLGAEENSRLQLNSANHVESKEARKEREKLVESYEQSFRRIKCTTGVSDTDDIIDRILGQEHNTESLLSLTKNNQIQIDRLREIRTNLKVALENRRYSGQALSVNRQTVEEKEKQLEVALYNLDQAKGKYEKLSNLLIRAKVGVGHLQDQLDFIRSDFQVEKQPLSDSSLADVLWSVGNMLVEVRARIGEYKLTRMSKLLIDQPQRKELKVKLEKSRKNNQRVRLPSYGDHLYLNDPGPDRIQCELEDDEISREQVKRTSSQIIQAQERKKVKEREKVC